jgi:hypothetical protein
MAIVATGRKPGWRDVFVVEFGKSVDSNRMCRSRFCRREGVKKWGEVSSAAEGGMWNEEEGCGLEK